MEKSSNVHTSSHLTLFTSRKVWFFFALASFIVCSIFAFSQKPKHDTAETQASSVWSWFFQPLERNALFRLPVITSDIHDLCMQPGTDKIWIVGNGGLIAYSDDGGVTWDQVNLKTEKSTKTAKAETYTDKIFSGLISEAYAVEQPPPQKKLSQEKLQIQPQIQQKDTSNYEQNKLSPEKPAQPPKYTSTQAIEPQPTPSPTVKPYARERELSSVNFQSIYFLDTDQGWVVGGNGTILHTSDAGNTWQKKSSGTTSNLSAVQFTDEKNGWAVGWYGTILHTSDAGNTWEIPLLPYKIYPAPWYYFSLAIVIALLLQATRKPKPVSAKPSIANMLISDRPIEEGDPDPIGFHRVALGLSRFLRNENTQPPLTIAITGEWGTGKSSLMNLLRANLLKYGFRPVWFNAWHHQKEEHLLASLLANIRAQAIPSWWRWSGLIFRIKLLKIRGWRKWLPVLGMLCLFMYSLGYFASDPSRVENVPKALKELKTDTSEQIKNFFKSNDDEGNTKTSAKETTNTSTNTFILTSLISALGLLYSGWKGLTAFGVNPSSLMASMAGKVGVKDFQAQTSFRYRFAEEFYDVTRALHPRTMLILIDDLDRCRPKNVLEVLEAINFLATSGECFIVMGMDRSRVERCVGLGFKDVAEELLDDIKEHEEEEREIHLDEDEKGRRRRAEFAAQYLEKLVNIEVPVPKPTSEQSRKLISPLKHDSTPQNSQEKRLKHIFKLAGKTGLLVVFLGFLGFTFWLGYSPNFKKEKDISSVVQPATSPLTHSTAKTQPTPTLIPKPTGVPKPQTSERGRIINPKKEVLSLSSFTIPALIISFLAGLWVFTRRPDVVVKDSEDFVNALDVWHGVLFAKRPTPRKLKRFINRVRYFAMYQSAREEGRTLLDKIIHWAGNRKIKDSEVKKQKKHGDITEPILVALSAIHHVNPDFVEKGSFLGVGTTSEGKPFPLPEGISQEMAAVLQKAMDDHTKKFPSFSKEDWETCRQQFMRMAKGIRIH